MGFAKSAPVTTAINGHIQWSAKEDKDGVLPYPVPNIKFPVKDEATGKWSNTMLLEKGSRQQPQISGVITNFTFFAKQGYNDRLNGLKGEDGNPAQNLHVALLRLGGVAGEPDSNLSFDVISDVGSPDTRSLGLLNSLVALANSVKDGSVPVGTPVQVNLYSKTKDGKSYANSLIRLPSGYDAEGNAEFKDAKNFVKSPNFPPRGDIELRANGDPLLVNGKNVYNYENVYIWVRESVGVIEEVFGKHSDEQKDAVSNAQSAPADDGGVDLADAVDEAVAARPKMSA